MSAATVNSNGGSPWIPGLASTGQYSSRLSARSALHTELHLLLDDRKRALTSDEYRSLVVDGNCLARGSVSARRKLWKELHRLSYVAAFFGLLHLTLSPHASLVWILFFIALFSLLIVSRILIWGERTVKGAK